MVLVATTTSWATDVTVNSDPNADFTAFKTVAWKEGMPAQRPEIQSVIVDAVEEQLAANGLTLVDGNADLHVMTHAFATDEGAITVNRYSARWLEVGAVKVGTLMIDLVDAGGDKLVWRGTAKKTFKLDAKPSEKKIRSVVKKLFGNYPP